MAGARDRQKLGDTLDDAQDYSLIEIVHTNTRWSRRRGTS
jgi:hypothetical protein